ncbi:hypothetical protein D3C76_1821540 [compost metagenome]
MIGLLYGLFGEAANCNDISACATGNAKLNSRPKDRPARLNWDLFTNTPPARNDAPKHWID